MAVEAIIRFLKARHLKGDPFHCPRTFQLVKELAGYIIRDDVRVELSDELVAQVVDRMAGLSHQDWVYLFRDFVHENCVDSLVGGVL